MLLAITFLLLQTAAAQYTVHFFDDGTCGTASSPPSKGITMGECFAIDGAAMTFSVPDGGITLATLQTGSCTGEVIGDNLDCKVDGTECCAITAGDETVSYKVAPTETTTMYFYDDGECKTQSTDPPTGTFQYGYCSDLGELAFLYATPVDGVSVGSILLSSCDGQVLGSGLDCKVDGSECCALTIGDETVAYTIGAGYTHPSPPPSPAAPADDKPCFARDTFAIDANGEAVAMASLKAGDYVMDGPDSYTRVIVNQHAQVSLKSSLLRIGTEAATIGLTPDHVLAVDGKFVPARNVVVGSMLSEGEVLSVTSTSGEVINPLTASGKILTQGGILSSTYPEWIADYMLSSVLFPLPISLSNLLSYLFPEATQNYYDAAIEGFVTRYHPTHLKAALPRALLPVAFLLGDLAVSAGFVGFNLASAKGLCAVAAVAAAAKTGKK